MKARQLLNKSVTKSTFNYVGFCEPRVDTLTLKEEIELYSDKYDYKDVWETSLECSCVFKELEMVGLIERKEEAVSYKLMKYREKAMKIAKKIWWDEYLDSDEKLKTEINEENAILSHWMKSQKMTPERFMRDTFDGEKPTIFKDETIKGLNKNIDDKILKEMNSPRKEKTVVIGKLEMSMFNDIYTLMTYLAGVQELRQIIHNNSWGICLKDCKLATYPEKKYIGNLARILQDMINCRSNDTKVSCFTDCDENITGKAPRERADLLYVWSHAPEGSVLAKCWNSLESLNYSDMDQVIEWQNNKPSYCKVDKSEEFYYAEEMHRLPEYVVVRS